MFDRCGHHSHKLFCKKWLNVKVFRFFFPRNETRIFFCLYRIITETCNHALLNHHFINTFRFLACFNPYRVIFRECNGYISATCVNKMRKKVKWSRYRPGLAQTLGRVIALLFHDRGTRSWWVVSSTPWPQFTPGKDPVPIVQEAGCASGQVWTGGKSRPHRDFFFRSRTVQPVVSRYTDWVTRPTNKVRPVVMFKLEWIV